jgi:hypothetical protein
MNELRPATSALLPDYWLPRPGADPTEEMRHAFDALLTTTLSTDRCPTIEYKLPWPKWQFLCYVADQHAIALHGSGDPDISLFEPRQSQDINEFGNRKAIYAAADGLWPMFFAVVDRPRIMSITNACVRITDQGGALHGPYYVFSVSQAALPHQPWRTGTIYLLPRAPFELQESFPFGPYQVQVAQLAAFEPLQPLAKLAVTPADFPFLTAIRGHDDARIQEYATALQTGAAWPEE